MRIATWNVNSVRARKERILKMLAQHQPDVLCLQELKGVDEIFPFDEIREAGYHAAVYGQSTYNGVAILSKVPPKNVMRGFLDDVEDTQARIIAATVSDIQIISVYVPNGAEVGCDKYHYKLAWIDRLRAYLDRNFTSEDPLVLCGDFNMADDERDIAYPEKWANTVLCHPDVLEAFSHVAEFGLEDAFRAVNPDEGNYSWWNYRTFFLKQNDGLRIDHIWSTAPMIERARHAFVDRDERQGDGPSDHVPVIVDFD